MTWVFWNFWYDVWCFQFLKCTFLCCAILRKKVMILNTVIFILNQNSSRYVVKIDSLGQSNRVESN